MDLSNILNKYLSNHQYVWLVTGCAGFIGSHLVENLLKQNQVVKGVDNFSSGNQRNLDLIKANVADTQWKNFYFNQSDIRNDKDCQEALSDVDFVLHQAALGSVPKSIENPILWNENNISGSLQIMTQAKDSLRLQGFVYASSSSVYGDSAYLPKKEEVIGKPCSPYAVTKLCNELYAEVFYSCYNFCSIGLRYFNVFGARQDPNGAYAAVIPKWISNLVTGQPCVINGDGETTRDFCYIDNVVQANILAALKCKPVNNKFGANRVYNVGVGENISLKNLHQLILREVTKITNREYSEPIYGDFRVGDIRHSLASIDSITADLEYKPTHNLADGLKECVSFYLNQVD